MLSSNYHELNLSIVNQGVMLAPTMPHPHLNNNSKITITQLMDLPCSVYFSNCQSDYQLINEVCAEICGFDSPIAAINKSLLHTAHRKSAVNIFKNDQIVMWHESKIMLSESLKLKNGESRRGFSLKMPWYNYEKNVIGFLGITITSDMQSTVEVMSTLAEVGFLTVNDNRDGVWNRQKSQSFHAMLDLLSIKEKQCLHWILKGKSAKTIANQLRLSHRTIEIHIKSIKNKFNCRTLPELMAIFINHSI